MKAIIYSRCSTDEKHQDVSLQTVPLVDYCQRQSWDYEVVEEYATGKSLKKRPLLTNILDLAFKKRFDILLVTKLDRLSRILADTVEIMKKLDDYGIRLIVLDQQIDTDKKSATGRMYAQMIAVFAEFEGQMIVDRIKTGIEKAKQNGTKSGKEIGRPKEPINIVQAKMLIEDEKMSYRKAAEAMGINVNTLIRRLKDYQS